MDKDREQILLEHMNGVYGIMERDACHYNQLAEKAAVELADVDKVVGSMETINKQNASIKQMETMIQELEQKTKILGNKVTEKSFEVSKAQFDAKLQKILDRAQLEADQSKGEE